MRIAHYMPAYRGQVDYDAAISMSAVRAWCAASGHEWINLTSKGWIEDGRNQAVMSASDADADLLVMQDSDVGFDGDLVPQLMAKMIEENAAVVGVPVKRRGKGDRLNCTLYGDIGTGLMMIDVPMVIGSMTPPWFKRETNASGTKTTVGEDIAFCRLVRDAGLTIAICGDVLTRHHGETVLHTSKEDGDSSGWKLTKTPLAAEMPGEATTALTVGG